MLFTSPFLTPNMRLFNRTTRECNPFLFPKLGKRGCPKPVKRESLNLGRNISRVEASNRLAGLTPYLNSKF
uniref:Uncharacterized protein n=1 Tax=Rhizophora mucronata TaxID=61149 RepID=A0A2P2MY08_RHIMU